MIKVMVSTCWELKTHNCFVTRYGINASTPKNTDYILAPLTNFIDLNLFTILVLQYMQLHSCSSFSYSVHCWLKLHPGLSAAYNAITSLFLKLGANYPLCDLIKSIENLETFLI